MSNFALFVCGLAITLISGMGVAISQVCVGYEQLKQKRTREKEHQLYFDALKEELT